jgi:hypothetical protein
MIASTELPEFEQQMSRDIRGETGWKLAHFDELETLYLRRSPGTW